MKLSSKIQENINNDTINEDNTLWIVYDGDCPFCTSYVKYTNLKEIYTSVYLINARNGGAIVEEISNLGLELNEGMVLKMHGNFYHGDECMHMLALLSTRSGIFNRIMHLIFKSQTRAKFLYPILRYGRNLVLSLLRRKKI